MIPPDGPQSDSQEGTTDAIESEAHLRRRAPSVTARARADTAFGASIDAPPTENFEFYRPPTQMVHWGQPQHLPHTNWFDLFFDLIYVATAFQLGTLLSYNVDAAGVTYFLALFYTMLASWHAKLGVDARIDATDGFHKIVDIVEALLVATSALHIEGHLSDIRDLKTHSALGFSLTTCALRLITTLRWHEVAVAGEICEISEEAKLHCRGLRNASFLGFLTYGLSALASLEGYNHNSADVACGLWITGVILNYMTPFVFGIFISAKLSSKAHRIPMHIEYSLHRNGEWIMLMIGESILSLIVGAPRVSHWKFYMIFANGFVCATSMQFIHYYTNPFHADDHAMRINVFNGLRWLYAHNSFSAALVSFGVSLKILLKYHDKDHLSEEYAWLFSVSLATAYVLNQYMASQHKGKAWSSPFSGLFDRARLAPDRRKRTVVEALQVCVGIFIFTIPLWGRLYHAEQGDDEYSYSSSSYSSFYSSTSKSSSGSSYSSSYASTSYGTHRALAGDSTDEPTHGLSSVQLSIAGAALLLLGAVLEGLENTQEVQHGHDVEHGNEHSHGGKSQTDIGHAPNASTQDASKVQGGSNFNSESRLAQRVSAQTELVGQPVKDLATSINPLANFPSSQSSFAAEL